MKMIITCSDGLVERIECSEPVEVILQAEGEDARTMKPFVFPGVIVSAAVIADYQRLQKSIKARETRQKKKGQ